MIMRPGQVWFLLVFLAAGVTKAQADDTLAAKAHAILQKYCARCHGEDGSLEGGLSYILDRDKLVTRKKIVPGDTAKSLLYRKVVGGKMPPADIKQRPTADEVATLRRWIEAGAVAAGPKKPDRAPLSEATVLALVREDLETLEKRTRRFTRYFSLAPQYNLGATDAELQTYRNAVAKLINSLSWHPRVTVPKPVGPAGVVLRIDLRQFMWDANLWNRLVADYPYGVLHDTAAARAAVVGTASRVPVLRADWFIASASRAPLYYDLLQIPTNVNELERQLRVDVTQDVLQERVARAGFNGSGVSRNNRVLERHVSVHGAYWRTYDFDAVPENLVERDLLLPDRRNLFAYPLGPGGTDNTFQHAGGEIIFSLPNGLQGFMLVNAENNRINKGPIVIVSDPRRPDRAVEAGVSCMSCHFAGINKKDDQIRGHVGKNPKAFPEKEAELIRALYVPAEKMRTLMDEDAEQYRKALEKTGNKITQTEPVSTLTRRYEADVDLETAAAEVGLRPRDFIAKVLPRQEVARNLGGLKAAGTTVSRQVMVQAFGDVAKALRLGSVLLPGAAAQTLPDNTGEVDPLQGETRQTNAATFSRDGSLALLASADRSVRLWDVEAGRELRRFVGHAGSVWSVAFSPDRKFAASGSADTSVRLWDVETGNERARLDGHGALVIAIAFSPDGKRLLSASLDHALILWDIETGKQIRRITGPKFVNALLFTPDGKQVFAAADRAIHLLDLSSGREVRAFDGHTDSVTSVALSPDRKQLLSGSDDGGVRLWDVASGRIVRSFIGHQGYVKTVAFSPDGKQVLSGASDATVRLWETGTGRESKRFTKHEATLLGLSFVPDGSATLSASSDAEVRVWRFAKRGGESPPEVLPTVPPEGQGELLRPARQLSLPGTPGELFLSPDGRWLYTATFAQSKLIRVDANGLKRAGEISLIPDAEAMTMTPDGKTLVVVSSRRDRAGRGTVQVIDAVQWKTRKSFEIVAVPYDVAADDRGRIYLSGGAGDWTDVAVVDARTGQILARWGGVWTRSLLRLSSDQRKLLAATQGVTPGSVDAFSIPARFDEKPKPTPSPARKAYPLGGPFVVSPDGLVLCRSGAVLHASDLTYELAVKPFLAAAFAPRQKTTFLTTEDGSLLVLGADLKTRSRFRLSGVGFQAVCDSAQGKLYVAVFDPKTLTARPGERGASELHVYDLKGVVGSRLAEMK
jgi:WD40 repeat protein/mono/diheme cytochrome c family protein